MDYRAFAAEALRAMSCEAIRVSRNLLAFRLLNGQLLPAGQATNELPTGLTNKRH